MQMPFFPTSLEESPEFTPSSDVCLRKVSRSQLADMVAMRCYWVGIPKGLLTGPDLVGGVTFATPFHLSSFQECRWNGW